MGKLRTINHPGVEIQEVDMSGSTDQVGGCATLVMGFFPQGESGKPVHPTSKEAVKSYFGTPETEAERYAYYACKTVFDNGGNLVAARIPYDNNSQYLTPAVKYNIEEWSTKHIKTYDKTNGKVVKNIQDAVYSSTTLTGGDKSPFFYVGNNERNVGTYEQTYRYSLTNGTESTSSTTAISANGYNPTATEGMSSGNIYYTLSYNPLVVEETGEYDAGGGVIETWTVCAEVTDFRENTVSVDLTADTWNDLITSGDVGVGTVAQVLEEVGFGPSVGKYLNGDFSAGSYYRYVNPVGEGEHTVVNSINDLSDETEWASGQNYYPIMYVSSTDGAIPYETFQSHDDFPERATLEGDPENISLIVASVFPEYDVYTRDGDEYTIVDKGTTPSPEQGVVYYKIAYDTQEYVVDFDMYSWPSYSIYTYDETNDSYVKVNKGSDDTDPTKTYYYARFYYNSGADISDDTVFKSLDAYQSENAPAFGNYSVSIGDITKNDGDDNYSAAIEYEYAGNTDGYFVYDPNATETSTYVAVAHWRRFWDYTGHPGSQWLNVTYNKYSNFTVTIKDSMGEFKPSANWRVSSPSDQVWLSGNLKIEASLKTGELVFSGSNRKMDDEGKPMAFSIMPIFHHTDIEPGMDCSFLTEEHSKYFNVEKVEFDRWEKTEGGEEPDDVYYTETLCSENKSDFYYDPTRTSPVTAFVDSYGPNGIEKVLAIKAYYESGEGMQYPEISPTDYLELKVWVPDSIGSIEDLVEDKGDCFDIIHREYVGVQKTDVSKINSKYFKAVPLSTDVTHGYFPSEGDINSDSLAITGTDRFDEANYPVIETKDPFGTGAIKVLAKIRPTASDAYHEADFYQFVSPYSEIEDVALAKSEKYRWIHWVTPSVDDTSEKPGILLSRTLGCEIEDVPVQLSEVENVVAIIPDQDSTGFIPLDEYQDYRDEARKPAANTIVIANITEQKFGSDMYNNAVTTGSESATGVYSDEVLGIVPVLMGGFQSLPRQSRIELPDGTTNSRLFEAVQSLVRGSSIDNDPAPAKDHVDIKSVTLNPEGFVRNLGTGAMGEYDAFDATYSNQMLSTVPAIDLNANYKPNGAKMNYVTLAVCQLTLSKANDNKIAVNILETFTGSLDSTAKDEKNNSIFIDNVVNNEDTGSTYVRLFSNYQTILTGSQSVTDERRETVAPASNDTKATLVAPTSLGTSLWWTKDKPSMSLGFTNEQTKKFISYATMVATLENVFDLLSNVDELDLDVVVDAGLSTIANRVKKYCDAHPEETKMVYDVFYDKISSVEDVAGWKSMCSKLTTFCQTTRKDCVTLLDAPRSLCVKDNIKLVDAKNPQTGSRYSVDYDILPKFNYLGGMNSSYAAGYCDWMLAVDDFSSKNVWLPPSIAAEGAIIYTDYNSNYWMAPAGQSRGNVTWAVDVAFNPNAQQQDSIYSKSWNYAINSSGNIMVWGQKTMLNSTSSFNRINIRRLFCRLERMTRKNSKWVIFELNNERTRNIYKDRIDPIFANVKAMGGIFDYQIIVDSRVNTPAVVSQNEFRAAYLIKPEHAAEYIVLTFFNMNQDMDFSEAYSQL